MRLFILKSRYKGFNKHDSLSLTTIFFDSSMLLPLQPRNSPFGFKQSRLWSLQFAKNCYRKISDVAQASHAYRWIKVILIIICFAFPPPLFAAEQDWRQRVSAVEEISKEDVTEEVIFGREVAARILGRYSFYDNPQLMRYVNLVGNSIALNTNRPEIEFHFAILNTAEINAYAAPGGYVFITRGALDRMQDESELAGVLAHEIAHITERHIVKELNIRGTEESPVSGLARAIGGAGYEAAKVAFFQAVDKAMDILFKDGYKREDEIQADNTGVLFCALSGYDTSGLLRYFERINSIKGKQTEVLDRTHPAYDLRVSWLKETISKEGVEIGEGKTNKERFQKTLKAL